MEWRKTTVIFTFMLLLSAFNWQVGKAAEEEEEPERTTTILVPYTEYEYWLLAWSDNQILCTVYTDHEGLPTPDEVLRDCDERTAKRWRETPPCKLDGEIKDDTTDCKGLYLQFVSSQPMEKEIIIDLPTAVVWVTLEGCAPTPPSNFCPQIPNLLLTGEEPLPNEEIVAIHGTYDGEPFSCPGDICAVPLRPTSMLGSTVEFWADSSYGDSSARYKALVRVIDTGVSPAPGGSGWYVDVISAQWKGDPLAGCARIWQAFPPVGEPPDWLRTPIQEELIASDEPYYYLAGRLISQGLIDVSDCASGGLLPNGYADVCGLEKANPLLEEWQNQFDARIIEIAQESGIPAQLIKNLFAQESQFWPGVFRVPYEFGLGQVTDKGADSVLLWNKVFYEKFCPLVLSQETCDKGYLHMNDHEQGVLRGAVALQAKSDCEECPTGIDLTQTNFSVSIFANMLLANCAQICQTIANATGNMAGEVSTYEDLWRLTVANYHGGPGCVSYAIHQAWLNGASLTWEQVKEYFTDPCKGVIPYVEKITEPTEPANP